MIKKPLALDHYAYINQLLDLKDDQRVAPNKEIADKEALVKKLLEQQKALEDIKSAELAAEAQANLLKIQRVLELLNDEKKKEQYDAALTSAANIELKSPNKEKGTEFVALAPIEDIINEFDGFKKEMLALKDENGKPLFNEGDFKYEKIDGPPTVHVFTFPDQESANKFMERLFSKNMAMYPNGSQSTEPANPVQSAREALTAMRNQPKEEAPAPSPTPLSTRPGSN